MTEPTKPEPSDVRPTMFSIQLIREVISIGPDGNSVKQIESVTAQIKWDTPDGQFPKRGHDYMICGDWRVIE